METKWKGKENKKERKKKGIGKERKSCFIISTPKFFFSFGNFVKFSTFKQTTSDSDQLTFMFADFRFRQKGLI